MKKLGTQKRTSLNGLINYAIVIGAYVLLRVLMGAGLLSNSLQSVLVPACCYMVMAVSLNLVVGISGELSLGHAGFMSLGAFSGIVAAVALQNLIPFAPLRLAGAMAVGAAFGALGGFVVGVPVLRLRGDYLAIVTLAFGQIIQNIIMVLYVGVDAKGIHVTTDSARLVLAEGGTAIVKGPMGAVGAPKLATFTAGAALLLVTLFVAQNLVNSRSGRAILALRDNRIAAERRGPSLASTTPPPWPVSSTSTPLFWCWSLWCWAVWGTFGAPWSPPRCSMCCPSCSGASTLLSTVCWSTPSFSFW